MMQDAHSNSAIGYENSNERSVSNGSAFGNYSFHESQAAIKGENLQLDS